MDVLKRFLKALRKKQPSKVENGWRLHLDKAPSHNVHFTKEFLDKRSIRLLDHPSYSPDLAPADFFLFPNLKAKLAGMPIKDSTVQKEWERVCRTLSQSGYAMAFRKWVHHWKKCIDRDGGYVEKSE